MALGRNIYEKLIQSVKTAVAVYGVSGMTTRNIAKVAGVSDSNIYRFFDSVEDLMFEAYKRSSTVMIDMMVNEIEQLKNDHEGMHLKECAEQVYMKAWHYLVDDPDVCKFHNYYYNSAEFAGRAMQLHNEQTNRLVQQLSWLFSSEEETVRCLYNLFSMLYSSTRVAVMGVLPNTDENAHKSFEDAYQILFCMSNRWPFK